MPEVRYPYVYEARSKCKWRRRHALVRDYGYLEIEPGDELALKHAVAKIGPVVVGISGHQRGFRFYRSG